MRIHYLCSLVGAVIGSVVTWAGIASADGTRYKQREQTHFLRSMLEAKVAAFLRKEAANLAGKIPVIDTGDSESVPVQLKDVVQATQSAEYRLWVTSTCSGRSWKDLRSGEVVLVGGRLGAGYANKVVLVYDVGEERLAPIELFVVDAPSVSDEH